MAQGNGMLRAFEFDDLFHELWLICRSITGDGLRESLRLIGERVPLEFREFETGMECFDWTVPKEWNIREAWIKDLQGRVIVDFSKNNLHILNYSLPKQGRIRREELLAHLYSRENLPDAIQQLKRYY